VKPMIMVTTIDAIHDQKTTVFVGREAAHLCPRLWFDSSIASLLRVATRRPHGHPWVVYYVVVIEIIL